MKPAGQGADLADTQLTLAAKYLCHDALPSVSIPGETVS